MRKILLVLSLLLTGQGYSQSTNFSYKNSISFSIADSLVSPYLCTVDTSGNLWVVSTNFVSTTAINGLFKANPDDNTLQLVIKFGVPDSVRNITGITSIGNDIFVAARMQAPAGYSQPGYYPYSEIIYLPGGDAQKEQIFKYPVNAGYGTWYSGLAASKGGYFYFGQSYLVTLGTIDGRKSSSNFCGTIDYARIDWSTSMDPGGDLTYPNVVDLIRDVAVSPKGNYADTSTIVFTSRNSSADPGGGGKGGITVWTGGTESNPVNYHAQRVNDLNGFLALGNSVPNGITVNPENGYLFVCGTDSLRKWVKGFQVSGNFAVQTDELPSSTSNDIKDAAGAPFLAPSDVAFNSDGSIAYVVDAAARKVFIFSNKTTAVADKQSQVAKSFSLQQNYPNPFNPSTQIVFTLSSPANVKVEVFNIYGQVVSVLVNGYVKDGTHALTFDGSKLASGVYICKVIAGRNSKSIKMVLLK
jgi:hypothetical protein